MYYANCIMKKYVFTYSGASNYPFRKFRTLTHLPKVFITAYVIYRRFVLDEPIQIRSLCLFLLRLDEHLTYNGDIVTNKKYKVTKKHWLLLLLLLFVLNLLICSSFSVHYKQHKVSSCLYFH